MAKSKLLSKIRTEIRRKNFSYHREQAYIGWMVRYIYFHDLKHPQDLGEDNLVEYLNYLAVGRAVTASTQLQARDAISFYYKNVLHKPLKKLEGLVVAKDPGMVASM